MFFDERFKFVSERSTALRVSQAGDGASPLVLANIKAPKNGYAYVYLSNESNEAVYFDNFQVGDNRGRIIEEDHYYSFGLKIAAISSKKLGDPNEGLLDNKHLYNDKELWDDADLNWYDYGFRNYDPQIGRFPQLDPLTDYYPELTPYQYAGNEPIANVDLDGLEPYKVLEGVTVTPVRRAAPAAAGSTLNVLKSVGVGAANAASSTCQGCAAREELIRINTATPVRRETVLSQGLGTSTGTGEKNDDFYLSQIRKERIEKNSYRPSDDVLIIGPLMQGIRRQSAGDRLGANRSGNRLKFDILTSTLPFMRIAKGVVKYFDDVVANPTALWGKSADEVGNMLGEGWKRGAYGSKGTGWKFTKGDQSIFYHPGGGRHGGSYYGFSSGKFGKNKIVGSDYIPLQGYKARIIKMGN